MGLWQTRFFIVKESNIVIEEEHEEEMLLWGESPLNSDSLLSISKSLHQEKSWSDERIQYGKIDGTCLEISYDGNIISEITCRIDVRNISLEILREIVDFMVINKARILISETIYDASLDSIALTIKQSNAYRFCKDPLAFLNDLC
ncbi:hypothetical protein [Paenibacillus sp. Soil750]|uniref:hypothetical protein n=1 Tax=Paenibacillus sp. Soil750 TaxID=1736398 RepID=UPI0012F77E4A|nr:hypothetical protein [Paenibacillus sp. Soil750]